MRVLKLIFLVCSLIITISACSDLFDGCETLVYGYTDETWTLRTKATEPAGSLDMYYYSVEITGNKVWKDVDHMIFMDLASRGQNGTVYTATNNAEAFSSLCEKHGDTVKSPVGCFRQITKSDASLYYFYQDFTALEVTSEDDFDSNHPAGSSLLDIIHYATDSPYRVLKNNYQTEFKDNSLIVRVTDDKYLSEFFGDDPVYRQLFNTFKKGTDVKPEDLAILGNIYISFDKYPDVIGPKHIIIQMTADSGEVYSFDTVLTFAKMEEDTESYRKWYDRKTLLSSVGVDLPYSCEYKEGEIVTADFRGITLLFAYTEASIDRCFFALLKAEDLNRDPVRRVLYKLFHRAPKQTVFDTDKPKDWNKAVRAALDQFPAGTYCYDSFGVEVGDRPFGRSYSFDHGAVGGRSVSGCFP